MNVARLDKHSPTMPPEVASVFDDFPPPIRARLEAARALIFQVASETGAGPLTETLKWGEPAYLTQATKSGSTIRLGRSRDTGKAAIFFNCNTSLVADFRDQFGNVFRFVGDRALILGDADILQGAPLAICLAQALTYHQSKKSRSA